MKRLHRLLLLCLVAVVIGSCVPQGPADQVNFAEFVTDLIADTADDTDPVDIDDLNLDDAAGDVADAFDDLLDDGQ